MRELTASELDFVSGGGDSCSGDDGNTYGGITDVSGVGDDLIAVYEGLVEATSYIIERIADAL
jgi:hypothetical protein